MGKYNNFKKYLFTEKLIGTVNYCIGCIDENNYYIPNTVLKEDIRDIVDSQYKIMFILRKRVKDKKYKEITYKTNKIIDVNKYLEIYKKLELNDKDI